jgi:hypothetical protein
MTLSPGRVGRITGSRVGGSPAKGRGVQISKTKRKGTLDLKALAATPGLDLDTFYGEPTESWTVRRWAG